MAITHSGYALLCLREQICRGQCSNGRGSCGAAFPQLQLGHGHTSLAASTRIVEVRSPGIIREIGHAGDVVGRGRVETCCPTRSVKLAAPSSWQRGLQDRAPVRQNSRLPPQKLRLALSDDRRQHPWALAMARSRNLCSRISTPEAGRPVALALESNRATQRRNTRMRFHGGGGIGSESCTRCRVGSGGAAPHKLPDSTAAETGFGR